MKIVAISDTHTFHERLTSNANFPNKLPSAQKYSLIFVAPQYK